MDYVDFLKQVAKRERHIIKAYKSGKTTAQIAPKYGVTRQRIQQILSRNGIGRDDGGVSVTARKREEKVLRNRDSRFRKRYGCSYDEITEIKEKFGIHPFNAYRYQKHNADIRNIEWRLSFAEWWKIWEISGKWSKRGRGKGKYNMARHKDVGPYEISNVRILSVEENMAEYYLHHKEEHKSLQHAGVKKMQKRQNGTRGKDRGSP